MRMLGLTSEYVGTRSTWRMLLIEDRTRILMSAHRY
jgi:hypothetical protein